MTHLRALQVHDEMRRVGMRAFVAQQLNGKRWAWVVVCTDGDKNEVFETVTQWRAKQQEVAA